MHVLQETVDSILQAFVGAFVEWAASQIVVDQSVHDSNIHTAQHASQYLAHVLQKVVDDELQAFVGDFVEWAAFLRGGDHENAEAVELMADTGKDLLVYALSMEMVALAGVLKASGVCVCVCVRVCVCV